jgi:excisionase family DNA binding protein
MAQRIRSDRVLLPTSEACKMTGFTSSYIQRLLREGRIEGIKLGRVWLIYEDSLTTFLAQPHKRGPKGPHKPSSRSHQDILSDVKRTERMNSSDKGQPTQET